MPEAKLPDSLPFRLESPSGMRAEIAASGALRRLDCGPIMLSLYVGNEIEGTPANLYLRRHAERVEWTPLLGPRSATRFAPDPADGGRLAGHGQRGGVEYSVALVLAKGTPAWFWHLSLVNATSKEQELDLTYAQDLALAPYWAARLNEYYVSQYLDHTPLRDAARGYVLATRQNLPVDGRFPWSMIGSLRSGDSFATDAIQLHGLAGRTGGPPDGLTGDLPGRRLQHEHSMAVIRDARLRLAPGARVSAGFWGVHVADHPAATSESDLERIRDALALPEATPTDVSRGNRAAAGGTAGSSARTDATHFSASSPLAVLDLDDEDARAQFPPPWRHEERGERGEPLSFFHGNERHVVHRAKELRVLRPHGQLLRTGLQLTPDESALTSTVWMGGVFHSMLSQGHVSINRLLSTTHSYLGLFRSHGQRVFVQSGGAWRLLDVPSAFEMSVDAARWIYRHEGGVIEVTSRAHSDPHALSLGIEIRSGGPARFLISHHLALDGDDGAAPSVPRWQREGAGVRIFPSPGTDLGARFPQGSFTMSPLAGTRWERVGGDELLFLDGRSRRQPFLCIETAPTRRAGLVVRGHLIIGAERTAATTAGAGGAGPSEPREALSPRLALAAPAGSPLAAHVARLAEIVPWLTHDALVHYLSPRGLEQYSGGGWGARDVSQGPVELLLALGRTAPVRDLLLRLMRAQNPDGDWPQWFMFFDRERDIRAGDSHGDIVFWPLVVLAQYLTASGDASVLDERVPFFDRGGPAAGEMASIWQHAERALSLIERRLIPGTALAAYGHGDWNDSLQPVDPAMRERLCSAWTVTLHFQAATQLARALRGVGRPGAICERLEAAAQAVKRDFQRVLVVEGVLSGYALFEDGGARCLLHPSDDRTGVRYSSLAMVHGMLEDLLTPAQAREHLAIIEAHLSGPDGLRLFDRPMPYHGGPQRLFQRAESAAFFGREIGLMYMHAHLRYAQALAHMGEAERFFRALCQANPIGLRELVASASLRQANCYYSSSDAAFADRYEASAEYGRVARGTIALEGGWRVYSSGAGIALGLILRRFLGITAEARTLRIDPVMPQALDGLQARLAVLDGALDVRYRVGPAGCGVTAVALNGTPVPFVPEANPHRRGAALVDRAAIAERLRPEGNRLDIQLG